ncbi:hypothetical protein JKP88DRAFT_287033 [Tribonema minus]|uniref:Uncharacterized protein n=1 Tax=Tribonema minus TaxID=303371 RepID=A0A836CJJ7_9STRA|nr:hypothetical protein JKP88DRAFT_287033 [Tribonema minus]
MAHVTPGARAYIKPDDFYGDVVRTTVLNLANSPVVQRDDGKLRAFMGQEVAEVVNKETKSDGVETVDDLPLDVRMVGIELMSAMGIPQETQALMFNNWLSKLTKEQRTAYTTQFAAVDTNDAAAVGAFITAMTAALTAL